MTDEEISREAQERRIAELETRVAELDWKGEERKKLSAMVDERDARIAEMEKQTQKRMREVHHRVKNSFNVVVSLLNMGARATKSDEAKQALQEARDRVYTMAYVYEQLQQSGDVKMRALATGIVSQYGFTEKGVYPSVDIPADMQLPAKIAIPCGLIITELVSNAFKHAFPERFLEDVYQERVKIKPEVKVAIGPGKTLLVSKGRGEYAKPIQLIVRDNGVGFPIDTLEAKSLGMTIVKSLIEQLDGEMEIDHEDGTKFIIRFRI